MIKNKTCDTYDITIHSNYIDIIHSMSKGVRGAYTYIMSKTFSPNPMWDIIFTSYTNTKCQIDIYISKSQTNPHTTLLMI